MNFSELLSFNNDCYIISIKESNIWLLIFCSPNEKFVLLPFISIRRRIYISVIDWEYFIAILRGHRSFVKHVWYRMCIVCAGTCFLGWHAMSPLLRLSWTWAVTILVPKEHMCLSRAYMAFGALAALISVRTVSSFCHILLSVFLLLL